MQQYQRDPCDSRLQQMAPEGWAPH